MYDVIATDGVFAYAMEWVDGQSLLSLVDRLAAHPTASVADLARWVGSNLRGVESISAPLGQDPPQVPHCTHVNWTMLCSFGEFMPAWCSSNGDHRARAARWFPSR